VDLERITPKYILYISMHARTNRFYNERGSRTNYVRSSIPHPPYIALCFSEHHILKDELGSGVKLPAILTLSLDGSEWAATRPGHFTSTESYPATHSTRLWAPSGGLGVVGEIKIPCRTSRQVGIATR
jgi:hypothetical protein